jgi:ketosteroid isomerase-like protein
MEPAEVNAEMVRRGYQALNEADMGALIRFFGEKVSWHTPGRSHVAGDYQGRESVIAQFVRYVSESDVTFKVAHQDVFTSDDGRAVGVHHSSAERNGKRSPGRSRECEVAPTPRFSTQEHRIALSRTSSSLAARRVPRRLRCPTSRAPFGAAGKNLSDLVFRQAREDLLKREGVG